MGVRSSQRTEVRVRAGVVHDDVCLAGSPHGVPDQGHAVRFLAGMRGKGVRGRSQFLRKLLESLGFPGRQHHFGACADEGPGDGRADAPRRSGDDGDPMREREGRWHAPKLPPRPGKRTSWL
jgi:hypothetical protein